MPDARSETAAVRSRKSDSEWAKGHLASFSLPTSDFSPVLTLLKEACPDHRGSPVRPCDRRDALLLRTIHVPCPWHGPPVHPCWQSRAAFLLTSRQNPGVPCESQTR